MSNSLNTEAQTSGKNGVLRMTFVLIAIALELVFVLSTILRFNAQAEWINVITRLLALVIVLGIYSQHRSASIKMPWISRPRAAGTITV